MPQNPQRKFIGLQEKKIISTIYAFIKRHPVPAYYTLVFAISRGAMFEAVGPDKFFSTKGNPRRAGAVRLLESQKG